MLKDNKKLYKNYFIGLIQVGKKNTVLELLELDCVKINSSTKFIPYLLIVYLKLVLSLI